METPAVADPQHTTVTTRVTTNPPPRRTIWQWAATWSPDPRWHLPLCVTLWLIAVGWVPVMWPDIPWWALVLLAPTIGIAGAIAAKLHWPENRYGITLQRCGAWLAVVSAAGATAWLCWIALTRATPVRAGAWLLLGMSAIGALYAVLETYAPKQEVRRAEETQRIREEIRSSNRAEFWERIFALAGVPSLEVVKDVDTQSGYTLTVEIHPASNGKAVLPSTVRERLPTIAYHASRALARKGIAFRDDWVKLETTNVAHVVLLHITTKDALAGSLQYPEDRPPTTIKNGGTIGKYETGDLISFKVAGIHMLIVGATGAGKDVVANALTAAVTDTVDADIWVGATSKLVPFVFPWLRPWLEGRTDEPVIKRVAGQDIHEVLRMLRDAANEVTYRNSKLGQKSKHEPTPNEPAIVIILGEAGTAARRTETIRVGKEEWNYSRLVHYIAREGRSACVSVVLLAGAALVDVFGNYGSEIMRDVTLRICLRTMNSYDGQATLTGVKNVDTTKLRNNTCLVQPSTEEPRGLEGKAYHVEAGEDVDTVYPIALRNTARRPKDEATMVARHGESYAGRWDRERLPELVQVCEEAGLEWPDWRNSPANPLANLSADVKRDDNDGFVTERKSDGVLTEEEHAAFVEIAAHWDDNDGSDKMPDQPTISSGLPDPTDLIRQIKEAAARLNAQADAKGVPPIQRELPELLAEVEAALNKLALPEDGFVPTVQLAIALGRIKDNTSPEEASRAAAELGKQLSLLVPNLRTSQAPRSYGDGSRPRGYTVARLRAAIDAVRNGRELPPESDAA